MSSWVDLDDVAVELAEAIANHLGITQERVIKMALTLLALDCQFRCELPRQKKEHGG